MWDEVGIVLGFYWFLGGKSIVGTQYGVLGSPNGLTSCQHGILKGLFNNIDRNVPFKCTKR
jgi:hypothetical protein